MAIGAFVEKYLIELGAIVLVAAFAVICWQQVELAHAHSETDKVVADAAVEKGAAEKVARDATDKNRAIEQQLSKQRQEASDERQASLLYSEHMSAAWSAERDGMRRDLAAFAAGRSQPGSDTAAACGERASTLGDALAGSLQSEESLTAEIERCGADTRSLLDAWPVSQAATH